MNCGLVGCLIGWFRVSLFLFFFLAFLFFHFSFFSSCIFAKKLRKLNICFVVPQTSRTWTTGLTGTASKRTETRDLAEDPGSARHPLPRRVEEIRRQTPPPKEIRSGEMRAGRKEGRSTDLTS